MSKKKPETQTKPPTRNQQRKAKYAAQAKAARDHAPAVTTPASISAVSLSGFGPYDDPGRLVRERLAAMEEPVLAEIRIATQKNSGKAHGGRRHGR